MKRRLPFVLVLLVLVALAPRARAADIPEPDIPSTLTLQGALQIFRARGLDLLIAEAQIESAAGDVSAAGAIANPSIGGGYYRSFVAKNLYETNQGWFASVGDSNAIVDALSGKRHLRVHTAEAALAAAKMQRADADRTLGLEVEQQYFQAVLAAASLDFAREVAADANATFELNQIRYKAGAISEVDLSRIEAAKLESDQAVDGALQALRQSKVALAFLLGQRRAFTDFTVEPHQLHFTAPAGLETATPDALVQRAIDARPDLRAQDRERERATSSAALARRQRFPDVGLDLQYAQEGSGNAPPAGSQGAVTPPTLTLSLTSALPLFYQQQGEIKRADADVRLQEVTLAKTRAQIVSDVESAFDAYRTSERLVRRMEDRLLDRAKRSRDLVELQYKKGAASLLEYLDARRTYIATNLEYLQDLTGWWNAYFQLQAATASELSK
ncbi:MAG TPA: TolC family protein [Polyangia bacterium]|nr:TolC family protein [Polyangia bacterium]